MQHLIDLAETNGITIEYAPLKHRDGEYRHDLKRIRLREGMNYRLERSTLAHELAHAAFGDQPSKFGPVTAKQERRADEWAAWQLITLSTYREAEQLHNGHIPSMAHELGVISRLVEAAQRLLLRTENAVYIKPRMGTGNWEDRIEVSTWHAHR